MTDAPLTVRLRQAWNQFWFADADPYVYAALRIAFGLIGCLALIGLFNLPLFWSCTGLVVSRNGSLCSGTAGQGYGALVGPAILAASVVCFVAMTLGVWTRLAVAGAFVSLFLVARWNSLPMSAAHQVLRALLFCLVWADCGRVWSVDGWRRSRAGRGSRPADRARQTLIWPLRLFQIQVAAIYLVTGIWKLANSSWRDGSALHYVFQNAQFRRFPMLASPSLDLWATALTYATLAWELSFAFLILFPRPRRAALVMGVLLHVGMWGTLELGPFSAVMIASYLAFVPPGSIARLARRRANQQVGFRSDQRSSGGRLPERVGLDGSL